MNKNLVAVATLLVLTAALLLSAPAARADDSLSLTLASPSQTGNRGTTLDFYGTITALSSNASTLYLNGDDVNLGSPFLTSDSDDSPFLLTGPLSMDPGDTYTGLLFTVYIDPSVVGDGDYIGSYSILGGGDGSTYNTISNVAYFNIDAVPEPSSILLLATGAAGLLGTLRRKVR